LSTRCPEPTLPLPALEPDHTLEWTGPVVRIYFSRGAHPMTWSQFRYYGPVSKMRFDHQTGRTKAHPTRGISYAAIPWNPDPDHRAVDPLDVVVLESFREGVLDRATGAPRLSVWAPTRALNLLKLSDDKWLGQARGNAALISGARGVAHLWSKAIYEAYPDIDGLVWSASVLPGGRAVALYERAMTALPTAPSSDRPLTEPFLQPALARIARAYRLTLL